MDRRVLVDMAVAPVLLAAAGIAVPEMSSQSESAPKQTSAQPHHTVTQMKQANETLLRALGIENGDVWWTVKSLFTNENDVESFRQLTEGLNECEAEILTNRRQQADQPRQDGTEITTREINATELQREARDTELSHTVVITMSLRWIGLAETKCIHMVLSNISDSRLIILEEQRLRIKRGDSVSPNPDRAEATTDPNSSDWVEWNGYRESEPGAIEIQLSPPTETANTSTYLRMQETRRRTVTARIVLAQTCNGVNQE